MARDYVKVKVSGLSELDKALNELDLDIRRRAATHAGKAALAPVAQAISSKVPVDTGGLKSTVKLTATTAYAKIRKQGKNAFMIASVHVGTTKRKKSSGHQALQVEFGANGMAAQPFVRPAIQGKEKAVFMRFRRTLRQSINKFAMTQARRNARRLK